MTPASEQALSSPTTNSSTDVPQTDTAGGERPFRVQVAAPPPHPTTESGGEGETVVDEEFLFEDLEAAYLKALEAAELVEATFADAAIRAEVGCDSTDAANLETSFPAVDPAPPSPHEPATAASGGLFPSAPRRPQPADEAESVTQIMVLEALLFVGGKPLPSKRLLDLLGVSVTLEQLESWLAELNARYQSENRPYEARLIEGGYCLQLRAEFESVRQRVFGQGPREVKLSQEALEILAFIAYRQPVTRGELEAVDRPQWPAVVRQLLRRQLVSLERHAEGERYRTTPRFLEVFGLTSVEDLPTTSDFQFK